MLHHVHCLVAILVCICTRFRASITIILALVYVHDHTPHPVPRSLHQSLFSFCKVRLQLKSRLLLTSSGMFRLPTDQKGTFSQHNIKRSTRVCSRSAVAPCIVVIQLVWDDRLVSLILWGTFSVPLRLLRLNESQTRRVIWTEAIFTPFYWVYPRP